MAFSHDGQTIATGAMENTVILWDLEQIRRKNYACDWVRDYLRTNIEIQEKDRQLCYGVGK